MLICHRIARRLSFNHPDSLAEMVLEIFKVGDHLA